MQTPRGRAFLAVGTASAQAVRSDLPTMIKEQEGGQ